MKLSCGFPPGPKAVEYAKLAESLGYERIWFYDSPALFSDVWVAVARAAEQTERIGVGTGVLVPSNRHVLATAAAIAGIEELAPGRLAVAVGTGFTARMMLGQKALPWKQVRRYIASLKGLLRGEVVEVEGKAIKLCHPAGYSAPLPLATPIVVAANGPKGIAVARELGDGVVGVAAPIPDFRWSMLLATGTVLEEGESFDSPRVFDAIGPAIAVVYHGTYAAAGEAVDNLPGGREWRESVEAYPEALRHFYVHEDHLVRVSERERPFINPALGAMTFTGTREELRARMREQEAAGTTELMYAPLGEDVERELRTMAEAAGL